MENLIKELQQNIKSAFILLFLQVSHLVQEKYEQRVTSGNIFDDYVSFLSGELLDGGVRCRNMEVSYTKEQQKQKQKQQNKNKDR